LADCFCSLRLAELCSVPHPAWSRHAVQNGRLSDHGHWRRLRSRAGFSGGRGGRVRGVKVPYSAHYTAAATGRSINPVIPRSATAPSRSLTAKLPRRALVRPQCGHPVRSFLSAERDAPEKGDPHSQPRHALTRIGIVPFIISLLTRVRPRERPVRYFDVVDRNLRAPHTDTADCCSAGCAHRRSGQTCSP